jgi:hypothetical protein
MMFGHCVLTVTVADRRWLVLYGRERTSAIGFLVSCDNDQEPAEINTWWSVVGNCFESSSRSDVPTEVRNAIATWATSRTTSRTSTSSGSP